MSTIKMKETIHFNPGRRLLQSTSPSSSSEWSPKKPVSYCTALQGDHTDDEEEHNSIV